jgi:hypothetical protein
MPTYAAAVVDLELFFFVSVSLILIISSQYKELGESGMLLSSLPIDPFVFCGGYQRASIII